MLAQRLCDKEHAGVNEETEGINCNSQFHSTGIFLYALKTSENQRFSDDFRGYRKRPVA